MVGISSKAGVTGDAGGKQWVPGGAGDMKCVSGHGECKAVGIWNGGKEWESQVKQGFRRQAVGTWQCRRQAQWESGGPGGKQLISGGSGYM